MGGFRVIGMKSVVVTIPTPAAPKKITPERTFTTNFELYNPTGNQVVYIGEADVASTTHIPRAANTITAFSAEEKEGEAKDFDLSELYILGTAGESVRVEYWHNLTKK